MLWIDNCLACSRNLLSLNILLTIESRTGLIVETLATFEILEMALSRDCTYNSLLIELTTGSNYVNFEGKSLMKYPTPCKISGRMLGGWELFQNKPSKPIQESAIASLITKLFRCLALGCAVVLHFQKSRYTLTDILRVRLKEIRSLCCSTIWGTNS